MADENKVRNKVSLIVEALQAGNTDVKAIAELSGAKTSTVRTQMYKFNKANTSPEEAEATPEAAQSEAPAEAEAEETADSEEEVEAEAEAKSAEE